MERAEDGLLSARELCDIDLTGTELVVLSACQTAQGVVSDEGPAGLVRGLKRAGVKTVIATLWSVDDKATALFMKALYENWKVKNRICMSHSVRRGRHCAIIRLPKRWCCSGKHSGG